MKLKKFFALALAAATLALALTACGSKADDSADNSNANTDSNGNTIFVDLSEWFYEMGESYNGFFEVFYNSGLQMVLFLCRFRYRYNCDSEYV